MQEYKQDRDAILSDISALAQKAVALNPSNPFVTMTMGRCHWLAAMPEEGIFWYDHAIQLCLSDSNGHYSRAMPDAPAGPAAVSRVGVNVALRPNPRAPSPMLKTRSVTCLVQGTFAAAQDWGLRAAHRNPAQITVVAATAVGLAICRATMPVRPIGRGCAAPSVRILRSPPICAQCRLRTRGPSQGAGRVERCLPHGLNRPLAPSRATR